MTPVVSVLIITYDRLALLQRCLKAVLETVDLPAEILVWDNGCRDGTSEWLDTLADPRLRIVHASGNLSFNGYALVAELARGEYLCEIDDDVIQLPGHWTSRMVQAFERLPRLGYLALDVVQDEKTQGGKPPAQHYRRVEAEGIPLELGPVGGWCSMTPRRLYGAAGGFPFIPGQKFQMEDAEYGRRITRMGYLAAILAGVRCYHACGPAFNGPYADYLKEKYSDYERYMTQRKAPW